MDMAVILVMWPGLFEQTFVPYPMKTPYEIWLQSAQWFQRRRCLSVADRQRTTEAYLSYKFTSGLRLGWAKMEVLTDILSMKTCQIFIQNV